LPVGWTGFELFLYPELHLARPTRLGHHLDRTNVLTHQLLAMGQ
jgi:hypothetical protein